MLFLSVALGTGFYSIRAADVHHDERGSLSAIVGVTSAALVVGALLWHRVLRRHGYRRMFLGGAMTSAAAALLGVGTSWYSHDQFAGHALVMLLATVAAEAVSVGNSAYLSEHASPAERPALSAFTQLGIGLASGLLAAALGGLAELQGTVWPVVVLAALNLVAVGAALLVPKPSAERARAASVAGAGAEPSRCPACCGRIESVPSGLG